MQQKQEARIWRLQIKSANAWAGEIRGLTCKYPGVFTDLAYNKHALEASTGKTYFKVLAHLLDSDRVLGGRILFGTDWSMTRHTWREIDYVKPFQKLGEERLHRIGFENSLDFLFPQRKLPDRIARFLKANGKSVSDLPKWLIANLTIS